MPVKMTRRCFEQKRDNVLAGMVCANETAREVEHVLLSWCYERQDAVNPAGLHDYLRAVTCRIDQVRRDYEQMRWAAAATALSFDDWLLREGHPDLVRAALRPARAPAAPSCT